MNPMNLFQIKKLWNEFTARHPKFPNFIKAVSQNAIQEGTILEIQVTCPDGKSFASNLKVTAEDLEMLQMLRQLQS
ncbi:hypothetical protein ACTNEF_10485 [Bariatricus sp. HCP28S3_E4]|uniref:hypothetical protein n=1 Tax=Lachnospiraceae TaxID=186803 RepID=UPI002A782D40|nr:hypothetical protein [Bariatricus sp.]